VRQKIFEKDRRKRSRSTETLIQEKLQLMDEVGEFHSVRSQRRVCDQERELLRKEESAWGTNLG